MRRDVSTPDAVQVAALSMAYSDALKALSTVHEMESYLVDAPLGKLLAVQVPSGEWLKLARAIGAIVDA